MEQIERIKLLPADLKRGVLSEDGIWNLLSDASELNKIIDDDKNSK